MRTTYRSPLFLVILFALLLASCGASDKLKSGDILFQEKNYDLAAIAYKDEYQAEEVPQTKAEKAFKEQQQLIKKEETFIQKNLTRASTTKRAQSRRKKLDKLVKLEKK